MSPEAFEKNLDEIIAGFTLALEEKCLSLVKSGGIDLDDYGDNMVAPKIVVTAALKDCAHLFRPLHPDHLAAVKNLENC